MCSQSEDCRYMSLCQLVSNYGRFREACCHNVQDPSGPFFLDPEDGRSKIHGNAGNFTGRYIIIPVYLKVFNTDVGGTHHLIS